MTHRFVEDFQNGKRSKGIKEAQERYKNVQGQVNLLPRPNLGLDEERKQVSGNNENILVRKSLLKPPAEGLPLVKMLIIMNHSKHPKAVYLRVSASLVSLNK